MTAELCIAKSGEKEILLLPAMANRHGLITGATGTGKTVTLQKMAESFASIGVPVFLADVKGDLSGIGAAGVASEKLMKRLEGDRRHGIPPARQHRRVLGCVRGKRAPGARHGLRHGADAAFEAAQSQ